MNWLVICCSFRCECVSVTAEVLHCSGQQTQGDYVKCCVSYSKALPRECHGTEMQKVRVPAQGLVDTEKL